jgi:hypothetical protein
VLVARRRSFRLLHSGTLRQHPDVTVELLLLRVRGLGQFAHEHRCGGDVLLSLRKLLVAVVTFRC